VDEESPQDPSPDFCANRLEQTQEVEVQEFSEPTPGRQIDITDIDIQELPEMSRLDMSYKNTFTEGSQPQDKDNRQSDERNRSNTEEAKRTITESSNGDVKLFLD
jgi:hypothetical protein